ncbi:hypothetical protein BG003_006867 [Podila horticola]|nr:hypothetical protein BG003_006867 [Podila horticola]
MPTATLNRDRTAVQQIPADPRERLQATQDAIALAQQYNQSLANGTPYTPPTSLETFMLSIALEEDVDLSGFSSASNNGDGSISSQLFSQINSLQGTQASQAQDGSTSELNQTQLLSGSRT